jgi:glycine dehydrogenase subunit 1
MPYIAATDSDRAAMLERIGASGVDELFADIPAAARFPELDLPPPLSEMEATREIEALAARNLSASSSAWFLGAGAYYHFIPAVVPALASRGEFLTAYTPYQPEVSQGTLQAIFEYQSMAAILLGVEVVNASHYDGATALAEGLLMAYNACGSNVGVPGGNSGATTVGATTVGATTVGATTVGATTVARDKAILCADVHPEYKEVIRSYLTAYRIRLEESELPPERAAALADDSTFCVVAAYPGFSGAIGDIGAAARAAHAAGALLLVQADPIMCGLLKSPGELGADIVAAEGQSLGNPMNFGGPFLGMLGAKASLVRKMPGRLVGQAKDSSGRRGFVLTLTAREQHIRREKAVSNICSNQGLTMLQACIYLAAMGKSGLRAAAELCWNKAHYAAGLIARIPGFAVESCPFFKEFTVKTPFPAEDLAVRLSRRGIVPGLPLSRYYPGRTHELLVCVTEMCTRGQIELLARSLEEASR